MPLLITRQKSFCLSTDITLSHFLFIVVVIIVVAVVNHCVAGIEWCVHLGWNEWVREGWKEAVTSGQQSIETEEDRVCFSPLPRDLV